MSGAHHHGHSHHHGLAHGAADRGTLTQRAALASITMALFLVALKTYATWMVEDGSFLRLKTVQLGYNLPQHMLNSIKISAIRVYASAQNLYTWTKYSGYDPEVSIRNSALTPGFDYSAYPRATTLTVGLKATF